MLRSCHIVCTLWAIAALAILQLGGCSKPAPKSVPVATKTAPALTEAVTRIPETPVAPPTQPAEPTETETKLPPESAPETIAAAPLDEEPSKERIVVLAPAHPLIVEFHLTIEGRPHTEAMQRLVEEVLEIADEDASGETTWQELCECKRVKYGQFGNLAIGDESSMKQVIDRYDLSRDGLVSREELPRFLTRNAGAARPFSVRGTLGFRSHDLRSAPSWQTIDADDDGRLSADEWMAAKLRLAARDADDDEIVVASDLSPREVMPGMPMMVERRRGPDAARLLGPHADWSIVQQAVEQAYGGGRFLRSGAFRGSPELFTQLDKNQDGRLRKDEYPALDELEPHLVLAVEFGQASAEGGPAPRLRLVRQRADAESSSAGIVEQPNSVSLSIGGAIVTCYVNDTVAGGEYAERAMQLLRTFDQNNDGYIEQAELPESFQPQIGRFEALDADENGKVYPGEIETYLRQQQAGQRAQIHARVSDVEDTLFATLDADQDGRLTSHELEAAAQRLRTLDADGDELLIPEEVPQVLEIAMARGSVETPDATFARTARQRLTNENVPRWFTGMDANQDGVISRREFLGTSEHFASLDKDANGLLSPGEAP
jgi:Ca2+-binding EF-hand superfamily protein